MTDRPGVRADGRSSCHGLVVFLLFWSRRRGHRPWPHRMGWQCQGWYISSMR